MPRRDPAANIGPTPPLRRVLCAGAAVMAVLAGCSTPPYSVRAFYEPAQLVWEPGVLGTWADSDTATETLTIACDGHRRLRLRLVLEDTVVEYTSYPFRLDGHRLADLAFREGEVFPGSPSLHVLLRYAVVGDTLWWGFSDDVDWRARLGATGWRQEHGRVVMDLPTTSLQTIALAQLRDSTVDWSMSALLRRDTGIPAPAPAVLAAARQGCDGRGPSLWESDRGRRDWRRAPSGGSSSSATVGRADPVGGEEPRPPSR